MVQFAPKKILQNKPLYTGFVVLELSKVLMYQFHNKHILCQYDADRARLLFTDTDSLCYQIQTDDLYQDMANNLQLYDTSAYPKSNPLFSSVNAKVIGKFKDETNSVPPKEFVVSGQKCIPSTFPTLKTNLKWQPRVSRRVTSNITWGIPHLLMPYVITNIHPRLALKRLNLLTMLLALSISIKSVSPRSTPNVIFYPMESRP